MAVWISFSLGGPIRRVFAGMLFTWWKKNISLLGETGLGAGVDGGWSGLCVWARDQLCFTSGLGGTGTPLRMLRTSCLGCGSSQSYAALGSAFGGSAVMVIASSRRGQTGLGVSWRWRRRRRRRRRRWRRRGVSSAQFLSLVSEEALPNKMSLSWDMPLSCDLVLMRNWALRNITLSCSCLSSR